MTGSPLAADVLPGVPPGRRPRPGRGDLPTASRLGQALRLVRWLAGAWVAVVVALAAAAVLPTTVGWTATVVTSGSMAPAVSTGDVVLLERPRGGEVSVGDIVVVADPGEPGRRIVHRVVERRPDGLLVTQGDANASPDTFRTPESAVLGVARAVVPHAGRTALLWHRGAPADVAWWILLVGAATVASAVPGRGTMSGCPSFPRWRRWRSSSPVAPSVASSPGSTSPPSTP